VDPLELLEGNLLWLKSLSAGYGDLIQLSRWPNAVDDVESLSELSGSRTILERIIYGDVQKVLKYIANNGKVGCTEFRVWDIAVDGCPTREIEDDWRYDRSPRELDDFAHRNELNNLAVFFDVHGGDDDADAISLSSNIFQPSVRLK